MRTYSEVIGHEPFNWFDELRKPYEEIDWHALRGLAATWVTCSCGNQCEVIPRDECGEPLDKKLYTLGNQFTDAIFISNAHAAQLILKDIEERSSYLITLENAKKREKLKLSSSVGGTV